MTLGSNGQECLGIITARGGSKGIPRKNLVPLAGIPLLAHTIRTARTAGVFSELIVSSDCPDILDLARREGAMALQRPPEISGDDARSEDAIRHALMALGFGELQDCSQNAMLLQPTSPLRTAQDIRSALEKFHAQSCASLVSVVEWEHPPQKSLFVDENGHGQPLVSWEALTRPRQLLPATFRPNGAIYLFRVNQFLATGFLFAKPMGLLVMSTQASIDIDSLDDIAKAEAIVRARDEFHTPPQ
jgi:CMP-N-acetylneuraminic acid synthetase